MRHRFKTKKKHYCIFLYFLYVKNESDTLYAAKWCSINMTGTEALCSNSTIILYTNNIPHSTPPGLHKSIRLPVITSRN